MITATEPLTRPAREIYRDLVREQMILDPRVICLDSDTGLFTGIDFGDAADRYLNIGISEHTLMGTAAGLAKEGLRPIVNTMATFAASRAIEAVKLDIALNNLPVLIAATHAGLSAGHLGPTHHSLEDLAVMRTLPNMTVLVPADGTQTEQLFTQALAGDGPAYLRMGRAATPPLPDHAPVRLGDAQVLRRDGTVVIAACGPYPTRAAIEAADHLTAHGLPVSLVNIHTLKPLDVLELAGLASAAGGRVITVEEHWASAGFGSAVIEALTELMPIQARRVAVPDRFVHIAGGQQHLLTDAGINATTIIEYAKDLAHDA